MKNIMLAINVLIIVGLVLYFGLNVGTAFAFVFVISLITWIMVLLKGEKNKNEKLVWLWRISCIGLTISFIIFSVLMGLIMSEFESKVHDFSDVDYVIILGTALDVDKASKRLKYRLETGYNQLSKNNIPIIVSGGKSSNELISQAKAMSNYLIEKGISKSRIILEDRSTSTRENLKFSNELINKQPNGLTIAIVTSDYHMYRAKMLGERIGWNIKGYSASIPAFLRINHMLREILALGKDIVLN